MSLAITVPCSFWGRRCRSRWLGPSNASLGQQNLDANADAHLRFSALSVALLVASTCAAAAGLAWCRTRRGSTRPMSKRAASSKTVSASRGLRGGSGQEMSSADPRWCEDGEKLDLATAGQEEARATVATIERAVRWDELEDHAPSRVIGLRPASVRVTGAQLAADLD